VLPTALVIGVQKGGTTWVYEYLRRRGDVVLPRGVKETFFFDRSHDRGLSWYERHFPDAGRACVEVAPTYINCDEAPARVLAALGAVPVLAVLRHPAERTFSLYLHMRRYGMTRLAFREAVAEIPQLLASAQYFERLQPWRDAFGDSRVKIALFDDLRVDPAAFSLACSSALGLPPRDVPVSLPNAMNVAALPHSPMAAAIGQRIADGFRAAGLYPVVNFAKELGLKRLLFSGGGPVPRLAAEDRAWLCEHFRPDVERLEVLLGRSLAAWKA
jgi:hypothetical protein